MPTAGSLLYRPYAVDTVYSVLDRLPDPDLLLQKLGIQRWDLRKVETDDEVSAVMDTRRDAVLGTPWRLEPYVEAQHRWLWDAIAPQINSLLVAAWKALPYGYSVVEVVLKRGTPITIDHLSEKPMEWFVPDAYGGLSLQAPGMIKQEAVPTDGKFILTRHMANYSQPYGEALLSKCYWPWFFRYNGWDFWMRFLERFADPLLLGQVDDPAAFVSVMQGLGFKSIVGVGREEKVEAITTEGQKAFQEVEQALLSRIQKTWLGQTLTSQMSKSGGSYAAAQVHNEVRKDKKDSDLRMVEPAGQTLVNLLWRVNGREGPAPTFRLQEGKGLDPERATRDAELVKSGVLRFTEQYLLTRYDLEPGDFVVPTPAARPASGAKSQESMSARPPLTLASNGQRFSADQQLVEDLGDLAVARVQSPIPPSLIMKTIKASTSPEDLEDRLATLYREYDTKAFRELMERALFAADVIGYVTAEKRIGAAAQDIE